MTARGRWRPVRARLVGESAGPDALLVAAGHGDLDAFAAFYDATAPRVTGLLRGVLDRSEQVDRLTEEVYVAAWRDAPAFDPDSRSAEATLLCLVRRALIGTVRKRLAPEPIRPDRLDDHDLRQENAP